VDFEAGEAGEARETERRQWRDDSGEMAAEIRWRRPSIEDWVKTYLGVSQNIKPHIK